MSRQHNIKTKLKSKYIWPTVVISCLMMIAMICVVISCVQYLVIYMIQNKVQMQDEQSYRYALMIEQGLQNGESIEQAIKLERSQINHSFQKSDGLTEQNAENTDESKTEENATIVGNICE